MDLVDRVETTRFVGSEFLLWLWFVSEACEGTLEVDDAGGDIELWLDAQLLLQAPGDATERTLLRGMAPSTTPEARQALRQGKLPTRAHINLNRGSQSFSFVFDGPTMALSNLKVPQQVQDGDEVLADRIGLIEELDLIVGALYREFLTLRLTSLWKDELVPILKKWVGKGDTGLDKDAYRALVERAAKLAPNS